MPFYWTNSISATYMDEEALSFFRLAKAEYITKICWDSVEFKLG
jgi:hypothetical protein